MKNKQVISITLILVLILLILGFIVMSNTKTPVKSNKKIVLYTIQDSSNIFFEGEVKNSNSVSFIADTTKGIVDKINVKNDQKVKAGDLLFIYKNNEFIEQKNDLEYELNTLTNKYNKIKKELNSTGNIGNEQKVSLDKSKEELKSELEGNVEQQDHLNKKINNVNEKCYTYVNAPFDGIITIGGYTKIEPSKPILTLDSESMQVVSMVSEKDIFKLQENQIVKAAVLGTGESIKGTIKGISKKPSTQINITQEAKQQGSQEASQNLSSVNSYEVITEIDNIKNVYPGFHVQMSTKAQNYIPKIPKTATFKNGTKTYVWVAKNGIIKKRDVKVSNWNEKYVQVVNGLNVNEKIVREAKGSMKEGDKIE